MRNLVYNIDRMRMLLTGRLVKCVQEVAKGQKNATGRMARGCNGTKPIGFIARRV